MKPTRQTKNPISTNPGQVATSENVGLQRNEKKELEKMVSSYFEKLPTILREKRNPELEVSFGTTRNSKGITKMDYDNVVKHLYSSGFTTTNARGVHMLRIKEEYVDARTGETRISNVRAEIMGIDLIQEYCKSNSIQKILDMPSTMFAERDKLKFTQKTAAYNEQNAPIRSVAFPDFNFNVKYQIEKDFSAESSLAKGIIGKWNDTRKIFRHMNRVQFRHPTLPILVDISIIRSSKSVGRTQMPQYTIQEAGVYENEETYEIELELLNSAIGLYTDFNTPEKVLGALRKCIRLVLSALQGTPYPIGKKEQNDTLQEYMKTVHGETFEPRRVFPKDFIGPSSVTLRLENVSPLSKHSAVVPNIRSRYCVTDKADGDRKLLYIGTNGRIYLIDTNMNVQFTGMMTEKKELSRTILDGEHIMYSKTGKLINLFAAFDVYYIHGKSVREFAFIKTDPELVDNKFRLILLVKSVEMIHPKTIITDRGDTSETDIADFQVKCKQFFVADETVSIFDGCNKILKEGLFEYNTDGLIFTPVDFGVAGDAFGKTGHLFKPRWVHSFKWKPAEFNTIDFLVSSSRDVNGKDEIHTVLPDGMELDRSQMITQYKVITLKCGFSMKEHGIMNPFQDVIDGKIPTLSSETKENEYLPVPFQPTEPFDAKAHVCNVLLTRDGTNNLFMQTEESEFFEEGMIVEFKYDLSKQGAWRWVPLRVRYDKTAELRGGSRNFGNSYDVANSNWNSIHNPITEEMITTGNNIPEYSGNEDVYYNNRKTTGFDTKSLKDFHNLYVKRKLIMGVSSRKNTLIDFAVGKAGDLSKWVSANLSFVFGVDISKDNIHNKKDGACSRYLNTRKKFPNAMDAIFLHGNSGHNIRNGDAFITDKEKKIAKALFGNGPKDRKVLEEGVYKYHGVGQEGFNISSCQFALHYFFENAKTLHSFLRNIADCTALGGYFIGTCYDGKKVFRLLRDKLIGEPFAIYHDDYKVFEITKQYDETGFPDNELSLNYAIDVYQESINKSFREYLVNIDYFVRLMEDYGFTLVPRNETTKMGLPNGLGSFELLYHDMENEMRRGIPQDDYGTAMRMTENEKLISFLNVYFVFRKTRTVNTAKITQLFDQEEQRLELEETGAEPGSIESISTRTKKYLKKGMAPTIGEDLVMTSSETESAKTHFIRKIDRPKMIIANYVPPSEKETPPLLQVFDEYDAPTLPVDYEELSELPHMVEERRKAPPTIVRGEIKKVIRVPKKKITIN